jgi:hypothetical protein
LNFKVNINEYVKVKLTDKGIKILRDQYEELNQMIQTNGGKDLGDFRLNVDEEGYTKMQMHEFMTTFAPHMHMGLDLPFEANIIITNATPIDSWFTNGK